MKITVVYIINYIGRMGEVTAPPSGKAERQKSLFPSLTHLNQIPFSKVKHMELLRMGKKCKTEIFLKFMFFVSINCMKKI